MKRKINMKKGIIIFIAAVVIGYSDKIKIVVSRTGIVKESSKLYVDEGLAEMIFPTNFFSSQVDGYTGVHDPTACTCAISGKRRSENQ